MTSPFSAQIRRPGAWRSASTKGSLNGAASRGVWRAYDSVIAPCGITPDVVGTIWNRWFTGVSDWCAREPEQVAAALERLRVVDPGCGAVQGGQISCASHIDQPTIGTAGRTVGRHCFAAREENQHVYQP
ncbi:hypothetical protein [Nonomuraea endophytica]|uniref:Uncharacterized protein n=1 Tax=Nonomuraea endophytica TaxID=714136 RepID=A0A7W8A011_9ACTN|nr:hypothetical protein [Nonomuraea endophytica]MBB5076980.1 hypothetical protein [Nonomuraea endophytica]